MTEREQLIADLKELSAARRKDHSYYDANLLDRAIAALSEQTQKTHNVEDTPEYKLGFTAAQEQGEGQSAVDPIGYISWL